MLRTCYEETGIMDFGLNSAVRHKRDRRTKMTEISFYNVRCFHTAAVGQIKNLFITSDYAVEVMFVDKTRQLSYRKDDRAMHPMYMGVLKNFGSP